MTIPRGDVHPLDFFNHPLGTTIADVELVEINHRDLDTAVVVDVTFSDNAAAIGRHVLSLGGARFRPVDVGANRCPDVAFLRFMGQRHETGQESDRDYGKVCSAHGCRLDGTSIRRHDFSGVAVKSARNLVLTYCRFVAVLMSLVTGLWGCAKDADTDKTSIEHQLIEMNKKVSAEIDKVAEKIDLYVAKRKYVDDPNKSRLTLHNGFAFNEGGRRVYSPHIGVKLHLPNVQEKMQLRFTSYDEDREDRGINQSRYQTAPQAKSYGGSLALFQDLGKVRTEFRPRVEYLDKLHTSYLFKFSSEAEHGALTFEPVVQLFGRSDAGTGQFAAVNVDLLLNETNRLTFINEEQYTDGDNTLSTNHGLRWGHQYNEVMQHVNALVFESTNRSTYHLDRTVFSSSFRHQLRKNVLHYSLTPYFTFAKSKSYHPEAGCDLKIELIF